MDQTPRKIADSFVETEIDDEVVVLRLADGDIFSLVGTSLEVWKSIDGQKSTADIAAELSKLHDAPADTVADDVAGFIGELKDAGFVDWA